MTPLFIKLGADSLLCQLRGLSQSASLFALHMNSYTGNIKAFYSHCNANFVRIIYIKQNCSEQKNTQLILLLLQSMFMYGSCFK